MTSNIAGINKCQTPCIDYSGKGLHSNINNSIIDQWNKCGVENDNNKNLSKKERCRLRPLLNENYKPFITDFGIHLDGTGIDNLQNQKLAESWNNMEQSFFKSSYNFDVKPITFQDDSAKLSNTTGYPYLESNCTFTHSTWLAPYQETETVCLLDYMSEHLTEYNKHLCSKLSSENVTSDIYDKCVNYLGESWKEDSAEDSANNQSEIDAETINSFDKKINKIKTNARSVKKNSKIKLDKIFKNEQLEKDYVITYNNNLFEIVLLVSGILFILHSVKPKKYKFIMRLTIFYITSIAIYYIYKNVKLDNENNINNDQIYKLNDDLFNDLNNLTNLK